MTEVASLLSTPDHQITTVRHYEAGPPPGLELVEAGDTYATTKEEEWISKKKTEVLNTKQIETRVKRQVVLEDGKVVEDSGPMVTTNTTEDTETQEHHQTELRKLGDEDAGDVKALEGVQQPSFEDSSKWVSVANSDGVVREVKERRVVSREETEEVKETEDVQHLGDITDEEFLTAVRSGKSDLRSVLRKSDAGRTIVSTGPRIVHESTKSNKVTDTEDTRELSSVLPDGKIVTETQRTTEHEETKDDELPQGAEDENFQKESSQRYFKCREQEDVDYLADGVNVGHEMRFKTETVEMDRRGDGLDEPDLFESLSARAGRRNRVQNHRQRGVENGANPLERKDAITRRPLDFDQEEETRKVETSKWLEHHFGSESRSSNNSTVDEDEPPQPPKTSFFNVTIKSQPSVQKTYVSTLENSQSQSPRLYSPVEPERDHHGGYYKGITEWSERRQEHNSPSPYHTPSPYLPEHPRRQSPTPDYRPQHSPLPDYRGHHSPTPDYGRSSRISPRREVVTPTPPQRKKTSERQRQRVVEERSRYDSGYRSGSRLEETRELRMERERDRVERDIVERLEGVDRVELERMEEPPPDYSPPSPPPMPLEKKHLQKTRFAVEPSKTKSGNIIGQSIRKLVGKIRSASAERKAKQRAKRSPSPSYQQGHVIDSNIGHNGMEKQPVQRYYLGEDPFAGSIYGRENKYDGVRPVRTSRRSREDESRSQSTLGRFSKSTSRLVSSSAEEERSSQTLPRHFVRHERPTRLEKNNKSQSTINVSIINTVSSPRIVNEGPAKPARTYKSNLSRSKSLIVHAESDPNNPDNMYNSNPSGLKSPGLISSLHRGQKDVNEDFHHTSRFQRNGESVESRRTYETTPRNEGSRVVTEHKRVFMSNLKDRAPELFKTLNESDDDWRPKEFSTPKSGWNDNGDIYEPPTRLRDTHIVSSTPSNAVLRRGSTSSTDFSETYHTTTHNDDPVRPSVTNTVKTISKKTIPGRDGRAFETIESSETKSVTKSHYRGRTDPALQFYETERRYHSSAGAGADPVVIEVRNYRR